MLEQMGIAAKAASYKLALLSSREKNRVLEKSLTNWNRRPRLFSAPTRRMSRRRVKTV
ncbi:gamma-glutamyl phosphate reductase [Salmonella enterica subsp. arizonae]|nr:gamma-glutamyl phosphate reductase [Salmonella enterica subsp. arizonae]